MVTSTEPHVPRPRGSVALRMPSAQSPDRGCSAGCAAASAQARTSSRSTTTVWSSSDIPRARWSTVNGLPWTSPSDTACPHLDPSQSTPMEPGSVSPPSQWRSSLGERCSTRRTATATRGQVADALAAIHELPLESIPNALCRPHGIDTLDLAAIPAEGHLTHATVERIAACLDRFLPSMTVETRAFNHGDFHPGNLVWHNRRLAGVVDWSNARPGPRWSELAYFRVELAVVVDVRLAKQVLAKYEARTGHRSPTQPAWDLLHVLSGHTWMQSWLEAYREQGRPD